MSESVQDPPVVTETTAAVAAATTPAVTEKKKDKLIDIYVRLNGDTEKDYCFCLPRDEPVSILHNIFNTLPLVLSPTFFYYRRPASFHLSTSPGFVTSEGALLFDHSQRLVPVDETKTIAQVAREGQLFVPIFKHNMRRWVSVIAFLLLWLYTDLPEWLTPTPGISLFTVSHKLYTFFYPPDPDAPPEEHTDTDKAIDVAFFIFHILKVIVIFLIFFFGGYNPISFNPFHESVDVTADQLRAIGWTGARRVTPDEWREENKSRKVDEAGGAVKAYEKGILLGLSTAGCSLKPGEGWDTPVDYVHPEPAILIPPAPVVASDPAVNLANAEEADSASAVATTPPPPRRRQDPFAGIDMESVLWRLGPEYEEELTKARRAEISRRMKLGDTVGLALKEWRRAGPLVCSDEVTAKYELRKKLEGRPELMNKMLGLKKND
ncbi:glucose signaling factor 2-domain-containing protein [Lipomyces oligophaga]|uniref:glucose signaling factor 2-domain-containing protein n=1 Tax=Lipomyces oligophaga TaxID=45792 RepID=UPI0034D01F8F